MDRLTDAAVPRPSPTESRAEALSDERRLAAYRLMVLIRATDDRCLSLQRQGRIGFYAPLSGQEAAQIGSAAAMEANDWVFPSYRELAVALYRGVSLSEIFHQLVGDSKDPTKGRQMPNHFAFRDQHFVSASSPIGTQISQAVGAAIAARYRKDPIAVIAYFGDGATSSNDFHAGLNFAGVFAAPVVFFCENNEYAISLPRDRQTKSATLAEKAAAYGFPGVVVDGNDLDAVYVAVREARRRALSGGGPTLIEAQVYRFGPHTTSDDPRRYRSQQEVEAAKKDDPLLKLKSLLLQSGQLTEAGDAAIWEDAKAAVGQALAEAERTPPVDPHTLLEDVFQSPTPRLVLERAELDLFLGEGVSKP